MNRINKVQEYLKKNNIDAFLVTNSKNRFYVTNFSGSSGIILITPENHLLITDFRYQNQLRENHPEINTIISQGPNTLIETLLTECNKLNITTLHIEAEHTSLSEYETLTNIMTDIHIKPSQKIIENLRIIKDEEELAILRKASKIVDDSFEAILKEIKPGIKEIEISNKLEFLMRELGASCSSFEIIVASGKRSALPHGKASDKILENNDLITLDFGAMYQNYASDITRTVMLGRPNSKQKEIYDIVYKAQKLAIENIKPGMTGHEADSLARNHIASQGYGEYFGHGTGHGLGLDVHESPRLRKNDKTILKPGMVVTIEPGIYLEGVGGVRIEDDIIITESGCEVLTKCTKELLIL